MFILTFTLLFSLAVSSDSSTYSRVFDILYNNLNFLLQVRMIRITILSDETDSYENSYEYTEEYPDVGTM